ncbi:MAG: diguanylate cyclase [Desulfovibrio sp.]|nr:diguanylate cyclase [Desulfovibrio sp.]
MSSNAELEALARELLALRKTGSQADEARFADQLTPTVLVARLLSGFSPDRWQDFCRDYAESRWCVLPVGSTDQPDFAPLQPEIPTQMGNVLIGRLFMDQIQREVLRFSRSGGDLSLVYADLPQRDALFGQLGRAPVDQLDAALAASLREHSEACDSMSHVAEGRYALLLPGVGQLRARLIADQIQKTFTAQVALRAEALIKDAPHCALGIACINPGNGTSAQFLMSQAEGALQSALQQSPGHICLAGSASLEERASLVHSSEKRFLFFGRNN